MTRAISLAALTVLEAGPVETIRIAAACGYTHVGLRPVAATPTERHWPMMADAALAGEIRAALDGEGVGVLDVEILRLTDVIDWDQVRATADYAAAVGAQRILVADNDPDAGRSRDNLARMGEIADGAGAVVALEFMPWTHAPNLAAARARTQDLRGVAMLIDAFHLVRSGGRVDELVAGDPAISYLQLCDIAGPTPDMDAILTEARADRLFPGEGDVDLAGILQRYPTLPISLEIPADRLRLQGVGPRERAALAITAMRRVLEKAGQNG
ncbi:sugar phosphate isomerase/epimerase [Novosphingobium sp. SG751A]|uniref:sugar phosphate isomerase/epimerase family protein n=1 Tax=Novosphingobium sp. SG751A TaxID=2587000 RepID=UPI0015529BA4|nr:sugar phosphate isomerase/epimerase [Novosphingobium sp. SG751A]NOW47648.1 sugar phosphate isomerase/epimerase [Novosphingobium sp. SG751A]